MTQSKLFLVDYAVVTVDEFGQPMQQTPASTRCLTLALSPDVELGLVEIPAGSFLIGAPQTEEGWHPNQAPQQVITLSSFWMGQSPVTQSQWRLVAGLPRVNSLLAPEPVCFKGDDRPVEQISWQSAIEFCDRLNQLLLPSLPDELSDRTFRLPSEAEWEYACRANPQHSQVTEAMPFHFGATITTDLANYSGVDWEYDGKLCSKGSYGKGPMGSDRRETTPVGSFGVANAFGLYDMHGLVREWCADVWHPSYQGIPLDGSAWISGGNPALRVLRGGSWNGSPRTCRSAFRSKSDADNTLYDIGFRLVL